MEPSQQTIHGHIYDRQRIRASYAEHCFMTGCNAIRLPTAQRAVLLFHCTNTSFGEASARRGRSTVSTLDLAPVCYFLMM